MVIHMSDMRKLARPFQQYKLVQRDHQKLTSLHSAHDKCYLWWTEETRCDYFGNSVH